MAHDLTPLQASAYQRFGDILRTYAGPILEEAVAFNRFTPAQLQQIQLDAQSYGIRVTVELVDRAEENPPITA